VTDLKKLQAWFETDLGYWATKENLLRLYRSREVIGDMQDNAGRLTFWFKEFKDITIQVTSRGKLSITYPEETNYEWILEKLRFMLVTPEGAPVSRIELMNCPEEADGLLYVPAPQGFRKYRDIFQDLGSLISDPERVEEYLTALCESCKRVTAYPPTIPHLCKDCKDCNSSLYSLARENLAPYVKQSEMSSLIACFLMYEYKTHLFVLSYKQLIEDIRSLPDREWAPLYSATLERLHRLNCRDSSLEPKILDYFVILLSADPEKGEEAIRITLNAVKWHLIREISQDPRVDKEYSDAMQRFENVAIHIINKARQKPRLRPRFSSKSKRIEGY
jgi:hypothetical protein